MKRRFQVKDSSRIKQLLNNRPAMYKKVEEDGKLYFTWEEMSVLAKATGLKSKKRRHIVKRFRLVIHEAIEALLEEHKCIDNTL